VIVVLNGAPRAGKSSIASVIQESFEGTWMNLGVDQARAMTPPKAQPGIGLRPGEPTHPAAALVPDLYAAFWSSVAAHADAGLDVVTDVGLYDPSIAAEAARRLQGRAVLFVGVRCPIDVVLERRRAAAPGAYSTDREPAVRWEEAVHSQWTYDLEVDTSTLSPEECTAAIRRRLDDDPPPTAFARLATFRA
jgi:chloramphenicol 3-O phosphotransferase